MRYAGCGLRDTTRDLFSDQLVLKNRFESGGSLHGEDGFWNEKTGFCPPLQFCPKSNCIGAGDKWIPSGNAGLMLTPK